MIKKLYPAYKIHLCIFTIFIGIALLISTPMEIIEGLKTIVTDPDILITDYIALAGIGAAMANSGLTTLMIIVLYIFHNVKPNGSTIMSFWLIAGFAFFGKNIYNVWPIIFGVWLYSKYKKEPFINYILIAVLGTTLAPAVNQIRVENIIPGPLAFLLGILLGCVIGFILPPLASSTTKIHQGYNLYNLGFAGGLLGMLIMSILRLLGIDFEKRFLWSTGNNLFFAILLLSLSLFLIIYGLIKAREPLKNYLKIHKHSGRLISDFYLLYEESIYINMGVLCAFSTLYLLLIGGDLNGPTISGILTIMGFGSFGKHILNVTPVMLGASLTAFLNIWKLSSPGMTLAILFSTALAPMAGQFGWLIGMLSGFIHVAVVMNTGYVHGGMNLYNNGFAAGFVALILVPIIKEFRRGDFNEG